MAAIVVKGVRPTKQADTPPPYYLTATPGSPPAYCHTCGRLVGGRKLKTARTSATASRYCSERCKRGRPAAAAAAASSFDNSNNGNYGNSNSNVNRSNDDSNNNNNKPPPQDLDRVIEDVLWRLLEGEVMGDVVKSVPGWVRRQAGSGDGVRVVEVEVEDRRGVVGKKGDGRVLVPCSLVETVVFGRESRVSRGQGRRRRARARAKRGREGAAGEEYDEGKLLETLGRLRAGAGRKEAEGSSESGDDGAEEEEEEEEEDDDDEEEEGGGVALKGKAEGVTGESLEEKRRQGQKQAEQRERVRNACRRAVVFGLRRPLGSETKAEVGGDGKGGKGKAALNRDMDDWTSEEEGRVSGKKSKRSRGAWKKGIDKQTEGKSGAVVRVDGEERKLAEAIMRGELAEPSFCKGEWGVRWREEW